MNRVQQTIGLLRRSQSVMAVLLLAFVIMMTVVIGAVLLLYDLRHRELARAKGEVASLSRILAEQTTRAIDGAALAMRGVRDRLSDQVGRQLTLDSPPVRVLLLSRIGGLPQVKSMFLVDPDGMVVNSSRSDFQDPINVAKRDFFREFTERGGDELFVSRPERAKIDGQWTFYLCLRLIDASGVARGVLVAAMSIDYFQSLYESVSPDSVSRIQLLNRDGILMAGQQNDLNLLGRALISPDTLAQVNDKPEAEVLVTNSDREGDRRLAALRSVAKYPLIVSTSVNESVALMPWRRAALMISAGGGIVMLFMLLATGFIVINLLRKERLEAALKESDERLRYMVQSAREAIVTLDSSRKVILFNDAAESMFGLQGNDVLGMEIDAALRLSQPGELICTLMRYLDEAWRSPSGLALFGIVGLVREGQAVSVELSLSSTTFRGETLVSVQFRDVSERLRAEQALTDSNRQLQELSVALENVREEERLHISRELHDELGQSLTGLRMEVSWLGSRLLAVHPEMEKKVASIKRLIDGTIAAVRRISSELRPLVLDDLGFAAAASWYVDQFSERTGQQVALVLPDTDPENGGAVATTLFRVLQESLTNITRHASAKTVHVELVSIDSCWRLSVKDDGVGFDDTAGKRMGLGLVGMRERVQMLGGTFSHVSAPGKGTSIEVSIPSEGNRESDHE